MILRWLICILVSLFLCVSLSFAEDNLNQLKLKFSKANHDTARITLLFEMGNLYIDGPSDSLLFYYHRALRILDSVQIQVNQHPENYNPEVLNKHKKQLYRAMVEIGIENFFQGNYDSSLHYYKYALEIANDIDDLGLISEVYGALGIVYKNQGEYAVALDYYEKALAVSIQLADTSWMAACYSNAGNVYRRLGNYTKALEYFLKALEVFEKKSESRRMAISYMNIGNIYEDQHDMNTALEYYSRALQISYQTGDSKRISECLMNIGNIYIAEKQYSTARAYFQQSIGINEQNGFNHIQDDCYKYMGYTWEQEGNFEKAIENYQLSYKIAETEGDKITLAELQNNLSKIYFLEKEFAKSLEHAQRSLSLSLETGDPQNIKNAYLSLSVAWEGLGDPTKALHFHRLYDTITNSLFNSEKYRAIKELEMKYETQKKEQELALLAEKNSVQQLKLNNRNRFIVASLIVTGLILVIAWILFRNQRLRSRHRAIELEQRLLRSQMNPHFIFNALIAIQSYIYKKDPVSAGDFLSKFAELIRITLENSRAEFVKLEKEIRMLNLYFELQALRFDNQFAYQVDYDPEIQADLILIPPMMAQPFVENAIEHGLRHKAGKGTVAVNFKMGQSNLVCEVTDDGIGRAKSEIINSEQKHKSMATGITSERLEVFSRRFRQKFELQINELHPEATTDCGTKVVFTMPFTEDTGHREKPVISQKKSTL